MDPDAVERKLAATLSADVAGCSRFMAQDDPSGFNFVLRAVDKNPNQLQGRHPGHAGWQAR